MERIIIGPYKQIFNCWILLRPEDCAICEPPRIPTQFSASDVPHRQIHRPIAKRTLIIPGGLTCALHILRHSSKKMVTEKLIKRPQIVVGDVIEFEDHSSNIIVAGNERNDYMTALSGRMAKTDIGYA